MKKNLGLGALIALVLSSMVGAGIFSLPQNIAAHAQVGAIAIGWLITGVGMIALALVYQFLSLRRPDLDGGIFTYAKAGFGSLIGAPIGARLASRLPGALLKKGFALLLLILAVELVRH